MTDVDPVQLLIHNLDIDVQNGEQHNYVGEQRFGDEVDIPINDFDEKEHERSHDESLGDATEPPLTQLKRSTRSPLSQDDIVERDSLVHHCYIALGQLQFVISEINDSAPTPLQAVKLLAFYFSSPDNKESTISSLKDWLADPAIGTNATLRRVAGLVFLPERDFNEALKYTNPGGTMELHALNVQIFIKMHRSDYAERQLRIMQQMDEGHTLTQLANSRLDLVVGGSKIQEAYLIFQDLSERYQSTSLLLNGKAVCCMHMGNFDEAETLLVEALNKDVVTKAVQDKDIDGSSHDQTFGVLNSLKEIFLKT
ncbi:coatomer subunit epsilon-1-like [Cajanus cajan]|uniref:coatomer subunit epsilon-1-like n=1 Tax=Cajanus cajan TaxID=3821 RepID=UPI00098DB98F|nr:coatomer subunit epsilon-1-like [Cajanus cajan]